VDVQFIAPLNPGVQLVTVLSGVPPKTAPRLLPPASTAGAVTITTVQKAGTVSHRMPEFTPTTARFIFLYGRSEKCDAGECFMFYFSIVAVIFSAMDMIYGGYFWLNASTWLLVAGLD